MPTGKEAARGAGRLSGGSRASTALKKVPTVKVIGEAAPRKGTYPPSPLRLRNLPAPEQDASPSLAVAAAAASSAAAAAIESFGYSPTTAGIMRGVAAVAASAAVAAVRSLKRPVTTVAAEAAGAAAPAAMGGGGTKRMRLVPPANATVLPPAPRGTALIVVPTTTYGAGEDYFWEDVVAAGRLLRSKKITTTDLRKKTADGTLLHRVPYSTMMRWHKDDDDVMRERGLRGVKGSPHWLVELETRRRKTLPLAGRPTVLGAAEDVLAVEMGRAAAKNQPYAEEEVTQLLLDTAIKLKLIDPVKKQQYTIHSNIRSLAEGFKERAKKAGVCFVLTGGRKLSRQRFFNANPETLASYAALVNPELRAFQDEHGKLGIEDVGNWDEAGVDLCDYAESGIYWCLKAFGNNVLVPYDQSPHFTLITGFAGKSRLVALLIKIGSEYIAPHPYNCQLLKSKWTVVIAQSPNGWVDKNIKAAFFKLQLECPDNELGSKPFVMNCDGHDSNTRNCELRDDAVAAKVFLTCPPSHTSAATHGGTQQCDLGARIGGPIARFKTLFRALMRKQHRAAMATKARTVTFPEIAALVEQALEESFDPSLVAAMNTEVGYYVSPDGYLQCDPSRMMLKPADGDRAEQPAAAQTTRSGRREAVQRQQDQTAAALAKKQKEINAALGVVEAAKVAPVPAPTIPVPRPSKKSLNCHGLIITSTTHGQQLEVDKKAKEAVVTKKAGKENSFWEKHRTAVREAEAELVDAGSPSKLKGQQVLKDLILSRSGHLAKATNNTIAPGETEGARLKELRAAMAKQPKTLCPPTPEKTVEEEEIQRLEGRGEGDAGGSGAPPLCTQCESCMAPINVIGESEDAEDCDAHEDKFGLTWCNHCKARMRIA